MVLNYSDHEGDMPMLVDRVKSVHVIFRGVFWRKTTHFALAVFRL